MATYGQMFRMRLLDQRSRLEFHYPSNGGEDTIVFIPFYENPVITENQAATYVDYNPVGRAGSLFAYTGSKSRKLKVSTTFTLPHLEMHEMGINRFMRVFAGAGKESEKLLFTQFSKYSPKPKPGDGNTSLSFALEKQYAKILESYGGSLDNLSVDGIIGDAQSTFDTMVPTERNNVIDTLLFFVTILRTSIVNKATNPLLGPPLVRLTFGTLYQSIPCVCKSYSISWEESAGYDLDTLTPRRLKVDLDLEEARVGNFGTYDPGVYTSRDNIAGWESAVNAPYTIDPLQLGGLTE